MKKIAFIGTGVMGAPMAKHLADAGHEVTVYNRSYEKAAALSNYVNVAKTIQEAIKDAEVVITIVGFPSDVEEIYLSENGLVNTVNKGTVLIDMTTSSPTLAKKIYNEALDKNIHALDAPVTGGDLGAINGTLSIMVGGNEHVYQEMLPIFNAMGSTVTYMGTGGKGQHAKMANQIAIAGALTGTAEALAYAKENQLDLTLMLKVINNGSASSWQSTNNGPKMAIHDKQPGFFIKHFIKDLRLAVSEKGATQLPVLKQVLDEFESLEEIYGEYGTQAIIDYYMNKN